MSDGVRIEATSETRRIIAGLSQSAKIDLRPTFKVIGIGYRKEVKQIFDRKQPRGKGLKWPELSPTYKQWKDKNHPGAPLLVLSGALLRSMTVLGASGNISDIRPTQATFGTLISYGQFHDDGTSKMPKRNFSEPSQRRLIIFKEQVERDLSNNFRRHGIEVRTGTLL